MTYYAYVHARPDTVLANGIFYVGKGLLKRAENVFGRNKHHQNVVAKLGAENILVGKIECSSEAVAFDLEKGLIKCLRRMGVALTNKTDGGEGTSGLSIDPVSNEKRSKALKGIPLKAEHSAKIGQALRGKTHSAQAKANMRDGQKNRFNSMSIEERRNLTEGMRLHIRTPEEIARRSASLKAAWNRIKLNAASACKKEI